MYNNIFVAVDDAIIAISEIAEIDISDIDNYSIIVLTKSGNKHYVSGFFAVELIWLLKPGALEGRPKLKWKRHIWSIHNLVAHPLMQLLAYIKQYKLAIWIHDITIPKPIEKR